MKTQIRRGLVKCLGAAALVALLPMSANAAEMLKFVEHAANEATAHVGPKDDNPGDILTFANEVFDAKNQAKAGSDLGYCVRVTPGKVFACVFTLILPKGQIMAEGPFFDTDNSVMAITGGTGAYAGASGEMALHARDKDGKEFDFTYRMKH